MSDFTWIETFNKLSDWLVNYKDRQPDLIDVLAKIGIAKGLDDQDVDGNEFRLNEIDPFTFFSIFMKYGLDKRKEFFKKLIDETGIDSENPSDFDGVPSAQALKVWLFPYKATREPEMIDTLWSLFWQVKKNEVKGITFEKALSIPNVGVSKLTECMFYISPYNFLPIDAQTKPWLIKNNIEIPNDWS